MNLLANARILIIDDEATNVRVLSRMLKKSGYVNVGGTTDPVEALSRFTDEEPDLVILDLNMPGLDGFGVLERIRGLVPEKRYLPVLAITGLPTEESKQRALSLGAKDFVSRPFNISEILLRIQNLLETRFLHQDLEQKVRERTYALEQTKLEVLRRLARAAEYRDDDTGQHTLRVGELTARIAEEMGLAAEVVESIRQAAPLHDVGKIGIPDAILLKPGKLTPEEFEVMKTHTTIGAELLSGAISPVMEMAETIARSHHEKWNGTGYPAGLSGEEIPQVARVVALADFYDALSSDRPYRPAWPQDKILDEIRAQAGRHFDSKVVEAFLRTVPDHEGLIRAVPPPEAA